MERNCEVHGTHKKWRLRPVKQTWTCALCRQDQRTFRKVNQNYEALKALFGKDLAEQYLAKAKAGTLPLTSKKLKLR